MRWWGQRSRRGLRWVPLVDVAACGRGDEPLNLVGAVAQDAPDSDGRQQARGGPSTEGLSRYAKPGANLAARKQRGRRDRAVLWLAMGSSAVHAATLSATGGAETISAETVSELVQFVHAWACHPDTPMPAGVLPEDWSANPSPGDARRAVLLALAAVVAEREDINRQAFDAVHALYCRGLYLREDRYLRPPVVTSPGDLAVWTAWRVTRHLLESLSGDVGPTTVRVIRGVPVVLTVCKGCAVVFHPIKRRDAKHCEMCAKRPVTSFYDAIPALKAAWKSPGKGAGEGARLSLPVTADDVPGLVERWTTKTLRRCVECGGPMFRNEGTVVCGEACKSRRRRRQG